MQSDDEIQTTLSKWPFILGDVILVATALVIAILGDWQLTNWQVASCVISVALGCGLFVLPYVVEFQVRVREEAEDRTADLRIFQRHILNAQKRIDAATKRIDSLETERTHLSESQEPLPSIDLTAAFQALESKISPINREQAEQSSRLEALAKQIDDLVKSQASAPEAAQETSQATAQEEAAQAIEPEAPLETSVIEAEEIKPTEAGHKKVRELRQRRTLEPHLLKRAIEERRDMSSEAVSRIIESNSKKAPVVEESSQESVTSEEVLKESAVEEVFQVEEAPSAAVVEVSSNEPTDMFLHAASEESKKRHRTKKYDTTVTASVFIGIGNKPYLRGSGGGLNWDTGVAMEFEAIGKWRWIAPIDLENPIEIQLFRNDEDPDKNGKHTLESAQQLDLSPVF